MVSMLRAPSTLTIAFGRAYGLRIFSISVAETKRSDTTRDSKPRASAAEPVRGTTPLVNAWSAVTML